MVADLTGVYAPSCESFPLHSTEVPGSRVPGQTGHYRNAIWNDLKGVLGRWTLTEMWESGLHQAHDRPCLGHREVISTEPMKWAPEYTWQTFDEVDKRRRALGTAIENLFRSGGFPVGQEFEGVGIWSVNRPEWQIVDLACTAYGKVTVALYDTLGPGAVEYVINHSELPIVFCAAKQLSSLLACADNCPTLKMIVSMDRLDPTTKAALVKTGTEKGVEIKEIRELEADGRRDIIKPFKAKLDQVAVICYTSGTTGDPKGVVITHGNMSAAVLGYLHGMPVLPFNFVLFSYLPLAHIYGRLVELITLAMGGCVGYFTGSPSNLLSDIQCLRPHFLPSVPRVLNRVYGSVMATARAPGLKGVLFRRAMAAKLYYLKETGVNTHALWDALVFKKVQAVLGGRIAFMCSGSAPIAPEIMDFLKIAFACEVKEGYGMTETGACTAITRYDDREGSGTVGGLTFNNEGKLVDVPELGYLSTDSPNARGELCLRGDNVFTRYYRDEKKTAEAIDADGWFHTGDVAEVDSAGRFKIIDRVKNIMKLSQGEYVALEKVTNIYSACPVVSQIFVHGDSLRDHLVAIVVPDPAVLSDISGVKFDHTAVPAVAAAIKEPRIIKAALDVMTSHARASGLKGFETVRDIHVTLDQFTVENNTMTPTFKIQRLNAYTMYKDVIDSLYAKGVVV
ncbi:hypothetical protein FRB94_013868 [Tulasnella sp. JGI-2019a]|nr:hypothetical protein FRB94_013868 [Tulasnella sp. JGI-2019a]